MKNLTQDIQNLKNFNYVLIGNGADATIALLQWAIELPLSGFCFISIDTGFGQKAWKKRMAAIHAWLEQKQISFYRLTAKPLCEWIRVRGSFPNRQAPWCAGVLKGLPYNQFLDEIDPYHTTTVVMARTQFDARSTSKLTEYIESSEHFGNRRVWHPLYQIDIESFQRLIDTAGFKLYGHRSLECDPCIYNNHYDFSRMPNEELLRVQQLEFELKQTMFSKPIELLRQINDQELHAKNFFPAKKIIKLYLNQFDSGCGMPYGCGQ